MTATLLDPVSSFLPSDPSSEVDLTDYVRPHAAGKFLYTGDQKFYPRGVTYGPFRPDEAGCEYHTPSAVNRDFALMAENGINAVRTYTIPPQWLLDEACRHGLRVMVGIPWEQHVTFLDDRHRVRSIRERVRESVRACANHPAVFCYTIGNEIPAPIVRWQGRRKVERFIYSLYQTAKKEDPEGLITYVNYPTTEYLELPFLDFVCFNVYLESPDSLARYLARLQNLAGNRPLVMAEIGLDSRRNGEEEQASSLRWQLETASEAGCAGAFVFSWTDEWHRGGHEIEDWDFGLTTRDRSAKPALESVREAFSGIPVRPQPEWPRISVVVCAYNEEEHIRSCLDGLSKLDYPDFEVLVVDDGSTDATNAIASEYDFNLIRTENQGLSNARNTGMEAATGSIVAYIDADAYPDPQWLTYLALSFLNTEHSAIGGPNIVPPGLSPVAECVGRAPGGPVHVLLTDEEAEHIPGCNMAFCAVSLWDGARPNARALQRSKGHVVFEKVGFGYDPNHRVLEDISFEVEAGTRLGIVGATGAGKTTLVNLLTRFYDPTEGRILLDGLDACDYQLADLRNQFAIVLQDPVLFSGSLAENIAYGRADAGEDEILEAARSAGAYEFILGLPEGLQTKVGERGLRLSGGERQRIGLARAFLKDAPILILDEPTSSVDLRTERVILGAMKKLMEGRTTFLIAHRPATLKHCDKLLIIEDGRLVDVAAMDSEAAREALLLV